MIFRGRAAVVQLAVFLGGGVLGPVWHLARHRNDHSHGADGQAIAFDLRAGGEPAHRHSHAASAGPAAQPKARAHAHAHPHAHSHPHRHPHAPTPHHSAPPAASHREVAAPSATRPAPPDAPQAAPLPRPLGHGHGSLAHFGLALLGAPALVPVPEPEPGEWVPAVARTARLTLFHPSFPLPRPPPSSRLA